MPTPAGGCLLTDAAFSSRLRDIMEHVPADLPLIEEVALLRIGRHFRVSPDLKIVLGRDAAENRRLVDLERPGRRIVEPEGFAGPTALVCGGDLAAGMPDAMRLIARFAKPRRDGIGAEPGEPARRVRWREDGRWVSAPLPAEPVAAPDPSPAPL